MMRYHPRTSQDLLEDMLKQDLEKGASGASSIAPQGAGGRLFSLGPKGARRNIVLGSVGSGLHGFEMDATGAVWVFYFVKRPVFVLTARLIGWCHSQTPVDALMVSLADARCGWCGWWIRAGKVSLRDGPFWVHQNAVL